MNDYFNQDAEIALLSILLRDRDSWVHVSTADVHMFSSTPNRTIFSVIRNLLTAGLSPEYELVYTTLLNNNQLDIAGGDDYLKYLYGQTVNFNNVKEYEKLVVDRYKARSLMKVSGWLPTAVENSNGNIDSVILSIKEDLDSLLSTTVLQKTHKIGDLVDESLQEINSRRENPGPKGTPTSYKDLDYITGGFNPGDLWTICARPSMGKSAKMCNIVLHQAKNGHGSLIFSLEMSKDQLIERFVSIDTGLSLTNIRTGILTDDDLVKIGASLKMLKSLPIYIDTNYSADVNYVDTVIRMFRKQHNIKIAWIDNINLMVERNSESTHGLGQVTRRGKLLAQELLMTVVAIAQLNRGLEQRDDKRPRLSDIRQSGNIEEDSDIVEGLYRDEYYNPNTTHPNILENLILKHRNGPVGVYSLSFQPVSMRII